jgi:predicted phage-related endonuclease
MNINETMKELAQWQRMQEEAAAMVEALKDQIKEHMTAAGLEVLTGDEHKATFKTVSSSRIDTAALKKGHPDIAAQYTKTTETKRFTFA